VVCISEQTTRRIFDPKGEEEIRQRRKLRSQELQLVVLLTK